MTIVVTGATGQLGRLVVESLLRRGASPADDRRHRPERRAARRARRPRCAHRRRRLRPTPRDAASGLRRRRPRAARSPAARSAGASRSTRPSSRPPAAAGVGLLAYTSLPQADTARMSLADEHRETEQVIRDSGIPFTLPAQQLVPRELPRPAAHLPRARRRRRDAGRQDQRRHPGGPRGCRGRGAPRAGLGRPGTYELGGDDVHPRRPRRDRVRGLRSRGDSHRGLARAAARHPRRRRPSHPVRRGPRRRRPGHRARRARGDERRPGAPHRPPADDAAPGRHRRLAA